MSLTRKLHPTDISVKDDPDGRALVLLCDEQEVGRITYADAYRNLKAGQKPEDLIQQELDSMEWAMGLT